MKGFCVGTLIILLNAMTWIAWGEEPATPSESKPAAKIEIPADETPEQAMVRSTKVIDQLDVDAAMDLYEYTTDREKEFLKAYSEYAVEITRLEQAVRKRFGEKKSDEMLHAIGEYAESDLPKATYKVDGDTASVQYPDQTEPGLHLVRVNGVWKINIHAALKDASADDVREQIKNSESMAKHIRPLAEKVESGDYKTADEITDNLQHVMDSQATSGQSAK